MQRVYEPADLLEAELLLVMLASDWVDGFSVDGFWSAMAFSLLYSTISSLLEGQWMLRVVRPHRRP